VIFDIKSGIAILMMVFAGPVMAQYPDRPIRIIVPFVAGGVSDILSRQLAQKITEQSGKVIVVDNRAGAGGRIGYEAGARAQPDGYTLTATDATYTMMPSLYGRLPWDYADLTPVALVSQMPFVIVVKPGGGIASLAELIARTKADPKKFNYGSAGNGSVNHVVTELFKRTAGVEITHIPYKGMGDAVAGLLGGSIDLLITAVPTAMGQVKSGRIVALGVTSATRSSALPAVMTATEAGIPFVASNWFGLTTSKGTPTEALDWLQKSIAAALAAPELRARIISQGAEPAYLGRDAFENMMQNEARRWGDVIHASRIHAE
jgi:tripartite-type tricarboxylate transporter receptor subunit TctC